MANLENFDLMSIGTHCFEESCKRLDFLPFSCQFCSNKFCLEHKDPSQHSCRCIIDNDSRLLKCPLCNQYVTKGNGKPDDNKQMELHISSGCTQLIVKKRKKQRCSHGRCREVNLMPLHCNNCYQTFCVRHRHPWDHNCHKEIPKTMISVK